MDAAGPSNSSLNDWSNRTVAYTCSAGIVHRPSSCLAKSHVAFVGVPDTVYVTCAWAAVSDMRATPMTLPSVTGVSGVIGWTYSVLVTCAPTAG